MLDLSDPLPLQYPLRRVDEVEVLALNHTRLLLYSLLDAVGGPWGDRAPKDYLLPLAQVGAQVVYKPHQPGQDGVEILVDRRPEDYDYHLGLPHLGQVRRHPEVTGDQALL